MGTYSFQLSLLSLSPDYGKTMNMIRVHCQIPRSYDTAPYRSTWVHVNYTCAHQFFISARPCSYNSFYVFCPLSVLSFIIIIMSLMLSARWGQPFTGSDFSMPADLAQSGTGHVHCADTILLCHPAILCMDVPFEIFHPFYQILDVLLVQNRPFCRCGQITFFLMMSIILGRGRGPCSPGRRPSRYGFVLKSFMVGFCRLVLFTDGGICTPSV